MNHSFEQRAAELLDEAARLISNSLRTIGEDGKYRISVPEDFRSSFFELTDQVNLKLMEDQDNFYGYFLFQMSRELRFDISSPAAVNFKGTGYVLYYNPLIFLKLDLERMESILKHEILHVLSMHLTRAKVLKKSYSPVVLNMAMDLAINKYLTPLPPYAVTTEWINQMYGLNLEAYQSFEYYADRLQGTISLPKEAGDMDVQKLYETDFDASRTHDLWEESSEIEEKALQEFTEKAVRASEKGEPPAYLGNMIASLFNSRSELPWNLYLMRLLGTVESNKKKTVTRRNRRQPDRLELRGELRSHKARIVLALDISGSISDEEFMQAMKEVLNIVKNHNHELTVLECDDEIRREYQVKTIRDVKERTGSKGGTNFNPVFEYANTHEVNLLIYFTDGKGEEKLKVKPHGYKILWIISGRGDKLSLKEPYGAVMKLHSIAVKEEFVDLSEVTTSGYSMNYQEKII
jgi:predicted metal-dependent peptidase